MMPSLELPVSTHPLLSKLSSENLEKFMEDASESHFEVGSYLFRVGEEAQHLFMICGGKVAIEMNIPGRESITIQTIAGGGVIGWSWLFPPYQWHFDARVLAPTHAIIVNASSLREKCEENHDLGYALLKEFSYIMFERLMSTRFQLINVYDLY